MKRNIIVYTALTGERDLLRDPLYYPSNYKFVCFTDRYYPLRRWLQVLINPDADPRRVARKYKILSHELFPESELSVWQDASMTLVGDLDSLVDQLGDSHFAAFPHRWRNCLYKEADHCILTQKDDKQVIERQIEKYAAQGFPHDFGLWETGILIRRNNSTVSNVNKLWWNEICNHSVRDQLSFSYSLWLTGRSCATLAGTVEENTTFEFDICRHNRSMREILSQEANGIPAESICAFYGIDKESLIRWKIKCASELSLGGQP